MPTPLDDVVPSWQLVAVTPSDTVDLPFGPCRGIWVGVTGNVQLTSPLDSAATSVVVPALIAGMAHPIRAKRIWNASTTATGIFAIY